MVSGNLQGSIEDDLQSVRLEFGGAYYIGAKIIVNGKMLDGVRGFTLRYHVAENDGIPVLTIDRDLICISGEIEGDVLVKDDEPPAG